MQLRRKKSNNNYIYSGVPASLRCIDLRRKEKALKEEERNEKEVKKRKLERGRERGRNRNKDNKKDIGKEEE